MNKLSSYPRNAGFTLVEMLVALALLSLLSLYAAMTSRYVGAIAAIKAQMEKKEEIRAAQSVLTATIAAAKPIFRLTKKGWEIAFRGDPQGLEFVVSSEGLSETGGLLEILYKMRQRLGTEDAFTTRRRVYRSSDFGSVDFSSGGELSLVEGVRTLRFRFFGQVTADLKPTWHNSWIAQNRLPFAVEISLVPSEKSAARWPRLVVPLALAN